ncbi:hypothetical protein Tcan_03757 [Toxocara canis]|uniref:Uncharacterized protein n=1 Tax=Toxocara canis TaxID=6265 RepID=A0A0B2URN2_TOXCA|nr:hypothetical protein Tcan_03757 [Toxocara canis]
MIAINMDELADKLAAKLLPQLTSALSDKLLAAVQPVVDRLDKLISIMSEVQPPATQTYATSWQLDLAASRRPVSDFEEKRLSTEAGGQMNGSAQSPLSPMNCSRSSVNKPRRAFLHQNYQLVSAIADELYFRYTI